MTCGIYTLSFRDTEKLYVGQSLNIEDRFMDHCYLMSHNMSSKKLNEAYSKFGLPISLDIEKVCTSAELAIYEQYYINIWDSVNNGFNTVSTIGRGPKLYGETNGKSKYSNAIIIKVFEALIIGSSVKDIVNSTGVTACTVYSIARGTLHTWLSEIFPEDYKVLISIARYYRSSESLSANTRGIIYPDIYSPEGIVYTVHNTKLFAKTHNLRQGNLHNVLTGKSKSVKGWKLSNIVK